MCAANFSRRGVVISRMVDSPSACSTVLAYPCECTNSVLALVFSRHLGCTRHSTEQVSMPNTGAPVSARPNPQVQNACWALCGPQRRSLQHHSQSCDERVSPCRGQPTLHKVTFPIQLVFHRVCCKPSGNNWGIFECLHVECSARPTLSFCGESKCLRCRRRERWSSGGAAMSDDDDCPTTLSDFAVSSAERFEIWPRLCGNAASD